MVIKKIEIKTNFLNKIWLKLFVKTIIRKIIIVLNVFNLEKI